MKKFWRLWAKALGEKASSCDKESDKIAIIRTIILATYLITNVAIVANAIRHWGDVKECEITIYIPETSPYNSEVIKLNEFNHETTKRIY